MEPNEVLKLIELDTETNLVEFKDGRGKNGKCNIPEDLWRPITAFANTDGGVIIFGVSEKNKTLEITGVSDIKVLQDKVVSYCVDLIDGSFEPKIEVITLEDKPLLKVSISPLERERRPLFFSKKGPYGGACKRIGNGNHVIGRDEAEQLIRMKKPRMYDGEIIEEADISFLDQEKIKKLLEKQEIKNFKLGSTTEELLRRGVIALNKNGELRCTVGGYLSLGTPDPSRSKRFNRAVIDATVFKGKNLAAPIIKRKDITGTLDKQIDDSFDFVFDNTPSEFVIKETKQKEIHAYPKIAIREALVNAVLHRDYLITDQKIKLYLFEDRIEIHNPGGLLPGLNLENLIHKQKTRNEVLVRVFRELKYIEELGSGIQKIKSETQAQGLPEPVFSTDEYSFSITLFNKDYKE